jgi:hypothetical protein
MSGMYECEYITYPMVEIINILLKRYIRLHVALFITNFTTGSAVISVTGIETGISAKNGTPVVTVVV